MPLCMWTLFEAKDLLIHELIGKLKAARGPARFAAWAKSLSRRG